MSGSSSVSTACSTASPPASPAAPAPRRPHLHPPDLQPPKARPPGGAMRSPSGLGVRDLVRRRGLSVGPDRTWPLGRGGRADPHQLLGRVRLLAVHRHVA